MESVTTTAFSPKKFKIGFQIETPDNWLRNGNPWEICRSEYLYPVQFYGRVIQFTDTRGKLRSEWIDYQEVMAMAYDTPIPGYNNNTVNSLRLWQAKSPKGFDLSYFIPGLYPSDRRYRHDRKYYESALSQR